MSTPDFTDTARAALLWVLWHHQGGSSPVGQAVRFALGIGRHDRLSAAQLAQAKSWAAGIPGLAHQPQLDANLVGRLGVWFNSTPHEMGAEQWESLLAAVRGGVVPSGAKESS